MLMEEEEIVEELLSIDNKIGKTNLTYQNLLEIMSSSKPLDLSLNSPCNFITDGEIDTVFSSLVTAAPFIKKIHINRNFVAVNKWLVEKAKNYYQGQQIDLNIDLDVEKSYNSYEDDNSMFIIYGFPEFVDGCLDLFYNKNTILIRK